MSDTLVVYNLLQRLRSSIDDHLYSFRTYSSGRVFYLNLAVRKVPDWVRETHFDTVVYHTSFLGQRWTPELFWSQLERAEGLKGVGDYRIALPQDEFLRAEFICEFVRQFEIDHVFSVAPEGEWPKIYSTLDRDRVRFSQVLTGYLSEDTVARIERIAGHGSDDRPIDIGYRAYGGAPWLGRHGLLKGQIADRFEDVAGAHGLSVDISTSPDDVLSGDDWFRWLTRCKYTIGVEGGASILDRDGTFKERTERYLASNPGAGFDEIEANCFPGEDGKLALFALSPRHLEACATRTCQILVEGDYSGVLEPGTHYIELKRDFSNLNDVLANLRDGELREQITERAFNEVVASGRVSYRHLVTAIEGAVADARAESAGAGEGATASRATTLRYLGNQIGDRIAWIRVGYRLRRHWVMARVARWSHMVAEALPAPLADFLRAPLLRGRAMARRAWEMRRNQAIAGVTDPAPTFQPGRGVEVKSDREMVNAVLLLYHFPSFPGFRNASTVLEHVGSFEHHSRFELRAVNTDHDLPPKLADYDFSAVILHYTLFGGGLYNLNDEQLEFLRTTKGYKVAFFQDEYRYNRFRFDFLNEYGIDCVYTCLEPSEFDKVYGRHTRVPTLRTNLPGYVSEEMLAKAERFSIPEADRTVDIGYRGRPLPAYTGRGAAEKVEIGRRFAELARDSGLKLDIHVGEGDRLYGDDWYRFMARCRGMLAVESGVSIYDVDDEVLAEYERVLAEKGSVELADLTTAERYEDKVYYRTISPRHFEAAAMRTCQIMFEGRYSGLMEPMVHYIPLKKDFSNIDEVIERFKDPAVRRELTENAHRDLIASGEHGYEALVADLDRTLIEAGLQPQASRADRALVRSAIDRGRAYRAFKEWAYYRTLRLRHHYVPLMMTPFVRVLGPVARALGLRPKRDG